MCFRKSIYLPLLSLVLSLFSAVASVNAYADILEEYARFYKPVDIAEWDKNGPNVVQFFSFNCSYCYEAEKAVRHFNKHKPEGVTFGSFPLASGNTGWQLSQYAYAAASLAGVDIHDDLFTFFHVEGGEFNNKEDVRRFFEARKILDRVDSFLESSESEALRKKIHQMTIDYGVTRVPFFVVNGKYEVTWGSDQTPEKLSELLSALARKTHPTSHARSADS